MQIARACAVVLLTLAAGCDDPKPAPTTPTLSVPSATVAPATSSAVMSSPETPPPTASSTTSDPKPPEAAGSHSAKEGEMCGGFAGIPCEKGLVCTNVMPVADGAGTCRKGKK